MWCLQKKKKNDGKISWRYRRILHLWFSFRQVLSLLLGNVVPALPAIERLARRPARHPAQRYLVDEASSNRQPGRKGVGEEGEEEEGDGGRDWGAGCFNK